MLSDRDFYTQMELEDQPHISGLKIGLNLLGYEKYFFFYFQKLIIIIIFFYEKSYIYENFIVNETVYS